MDLTGKIMGIDINHDDDITSYDLLAKTNVKFCIHKASQGSNYTDTMYQKRLPFLKSIGLLIGVYHFNDGSNVTSQVDNFMKSANPDDSTAMFLDFETNKNSDMTIHQAVDFMRLLESKIGREAGIYGGDKIKENIDKLSSDDKSYLNSRRLWLCEYGSLAKLPDGWNNYYLWQFAADGIGPQPHTVNGIQGNVDLNIFNGTLNDLKTSWAGNPL